MRAAKSIIDAGQASTLYSHTPTFPNFFFNYSPINRSNRLIELTVFVSTFKSFKMGLTEIRSVAKFDFSKHASEQPKFHNRWHPDSMFI